MQFSSFSRRALAALFILLVPLVFLHADEEAPVFALTTASGQEAAGPLMRLDEGWSVQLGGEKPARAEAGDLVALRRLNVAVPPLPRGEQIILANGDTIPGSVRALDGEVLHFRADLGAEQDLKVPLAALAVVWLAAPDQTEDPERLLRRLTAGQRSRDIVTLRNGDVLEGILNAVDRGKVWVEVERKEVAVERGKVALIALNTDLARLPLPREPYAHVVLANGARLTLVSARTQGNMLTGKLLPGETVQIPLAKVVAIDLRQGRADYLSDLKPVKYEFQPYLDVTWPFVRDGSVRNPDLRLGSSTFDKGIGLHGGGRLTYDLGGRYRRFEAVVGLDPRESRKASARVKILLDGRKAAWDEELTSLSKPQAVRVDVVGVRELTLLADVADRPGAIPGDVNWGDARLIRGQ